MFLEVVDDGLDGDLGRKGEQRLAVIDQVPVTHQHVTQLLCNKKKYDLKGHFYIVT